MWTATPSAGPARGGSSGGCWPARCRGPRGRRRRRSRSPPARWCPTAPTQIIRIEESTPLDDGRVDGRAAADAGLARAAATRRRKGEELLPAGTPVTPGVLGLAAACGYDTLPVHARAADRACVVFGDELLTAGPPGDGRVRDSLGPQVPGWLRRLGADPSPGLAPRGPVEDTLDAHVDGDPRRRSTQADLVCTTGGTMHGPVDHLHPALAELGARVRGQHRGGPARLPDAAGRRSPGPRPRFVAGLPGNPQSAIVALVSLVAPLLAGLAGRAEPALPTVTLGDRRPRPRRLHPPGPGPASTPTGSPVPSAHAGSAMLRGLARRRRLRRDRRRARQGAPATASRCCPCPCCRETGHDRRSHASTTDAAGRRRARGGGRRTRPPARWSPSPAWCATTTAGAA